MDIKAGMKVTYRTHYKTEKGIVKSIQNDRHAFVVYYCNGDWDNYENYTAARTKVEDLEIGWDRDDNDEF